MGAGVNASGMVVGSMTNARGTTDAFSAFGSTFTNLTAVAGATEGQAAAVNNAGQIAGTQYVAGQSYATVWNNGVVTTVGGAGSYATSINSSGDVAGMLINNGQGNAFVTQNGTVIDLGAFDGGSWSSAYGLNDYGEAAGYGMTSNGNFLAFIWNAQSGYTALGTLGGASSYAMGINNAGEVVGQSQTARGYMNAFLWDGISMLDLGTLGGNSSYAYGINNSGYVVGASLTGSNTTDGFLYENGVMYDMNSLLIDAPGWTITGLYGINDSNQVVGTGIFDGVEHAVLLTDPPPPGDNSGSGSLGSSVATPEPGSWKGTLAGLLALTAAWRLTRSAFRPLAPQTAPRPMSRR